VLAEDPRSHSFSCLFTMPLKGSTFTRSPEPFRTRSDGLPLHVQRQLIIDAESGLFDTKGDPWSLLAANSALYGVPGGKLHKSCKDRLRHVWNIKESNPSEYW
jgi:hypothetical protein